MSYSTIFVSNVLESYYRDYDRLPEAEKKTWYEYDFLEANRALLYGGNNKIVITSYAIEPKHLENIKNIMNWQNVENWYPEKPQPSLCGNLLEAGSLREKLVAVIKANPGINLIQYRSTPEFHELIHDLRKQGLNFNTPEVIDSADEFIVNYFHSKRGFRHLWSGVLGMKREDINIPEGFITGDKKEAIDASWWFRSHKRNFVIKYNRGVQGMGIVLNKHEEHSADEAEFKENLDRKLNEDLWKESAIVVEELVKPNPEIMGGSPSIEFLIKENGVVEFAYACEQILENKKRFIGVYMHPELLDTPQIAAAKAAGLQFGAALSQYGYRGYFDIDLVMSSEGKAYAVESNLRRTGGTHAYEAAKSLLGKENFHLSHLIILDLRLKQPLDYALVMSKLKDLAWNKAKEEGLFLANPDLMKVKIFVPVLIAKTAERVSIMKEELKWLLKDYLE